MKELAIAFAGAIIAFGFFVLGEALQKAYDRSKVHYDALVFLERLLNLQLDEIFVIDRQVGTLRGNVEKGHALLDLPRIVSRPEGLHLELLDIDLVNRLFSAGILLRRANNDIENLRETYGRLLDRYLDKTLSREGYIENSRFVVGGFEKVAGGLAQYRREAEDILARIRVRIAGGVPVPHRVVRWLTSFLMFKGAPLAQASVDAELKRLAKEVEAVKSRSRERLAGSKDAEGGA